MKEILFVINTMGLAGAESALLELMRALPREEAHISLYALIPQGEMFARVPEGVTLLNSKVSAQGVLGAAARRRIALTVFKNALRRGAGLRLLPYMARAYRDMRQKKRVQPDKLLWRLLSDGAPRFAQTFDLAIAFLEGGATYYVARHVKARHKAAFVHIDYQAAGYGPMLDQGCYDAFDRVFGVSNEVCQKFLAVYPQYAHKTALFENLLDRARVEKLSREPGGFTDDYAGVRLLTIGRLHPQKAYPVAIEALELLIKRGVDARWTVLGEGDERAALEKLIAQRHLTDRFLLPGSVDNPYPYLRQTDIYVHATRFEGKSVAIAEAMALQKPIVASDCTGNREQITNEENGLLVDLTPEAVAEGILRLINDPALAKRLAAACGERADATQKNIATLLALCEE